MNTVNLDFSKVTQIAALESGNIYTLNGGILLTKFVKVDLPMSETEINSYVYEEQIVKFVSKEDLPNVLLGN